MHLLTATQLALFRGERLVIRDLSFTLRSGEALILRGGNGAGKSSLLRAVAGLTPLAAGSVSWDGEDAAGDPPAHARRIAWAGHLDAIKPALTVAEQVRDIGALAAVGLEKFAGLPARMLSAGQKRRLALARVLAARRPLWLLDEPTTGLDAASVARFIALAQTHRAGGGLLIASTHVPLELPGAQLLDL